MVKNKDRLYTNCSRKSYIFFYLMALVLIAIIVMIVLSGTSLNILALSGAVLFILGVFIFTELHRISHAYEITDSYITRYSGIFSNIDKKVALESISDVDLEQNFWNRLLGYGNVYIHLYSEGSTVEVKNIDDPQGFVNFLKEKKINTGKGMGG